MSARVQIRPATAEDAPIIVCHRYPGETGEHLTVYEGWLPGAFASGICLGWLAELGGRVIGGAGLMLLHWGPGRDDPQPIRGRVSNVFVEPEYRRQGVARTLMQVVLAEARARGLRILNLGTSSEGRELYASLGFQASDTELWLRLDSLPDNFDTQGAAGRIP